MKDCEKASINVKHCQQCFSMVCFWRVYPVLLETRTLPRPCAPGSLAPVSCCASALSTVRSVPTPVTVCSVLPVRPCPYLLRRHRAARRVSHAMFHPVAFFLPFSVVEPVQTAHKIARHLMRLTLRNLTSSPIRRSPLILSCNTRHHPLCCVTPTIPVGGFLSPVATCGYMPISSCYAAPAICFGLAPEFAMDITFHINTFNSAFSTINAPFNARPIVCIFFCGHPFKVFCPIIKLILVKMVYLRFALWVVIAAKRFCNKPVQSCLFAAPVAPKPDMGIP